MRIDWNKSMHSRSPEETWRIAAALLEEVKGRAVLALHGELGAGKTCFVQGLAVGRTAYWTHCKFPKNCSPNQFNQEPISDLSVP